MPHGISALGAGRKPLRLAAPAKHGGRFYVGRLVILDFVLCLFCHRTMPNPHRYDPETDPSPFMEALWRARHLCTRAEQVRAKVPGSHVLVQAIISAIDDYAERETGNREYFWNRPHSMG